MIWTADQLAIIDQRIAAARDEPIAFGTVVTADLSILRATVTFDGSATAVPVKMFGHAKAVAGDRVGLVRHGRDWVITGVMADRWPESRGYHALSAGGSMSSTTPADLPGSPSFTFTKRWDHTYVEMQINSAVHTDTAGCVAVFQLRAVEIGVSYNIAWLEMQVAFAPANVAGCHPRVGVPAGVHTVKGQWARWAGTGSLIQNTNSLISFKWVEVGP